jgi:hypothetical protein
MPVCTITSHKCLRALFLWHGPFGQCHQTWQNKRQPVHSIFGPHIQLQEGENAAILIMERATGKTLCVGSAAIEPAIGTIPVEKRYNEDGTSNTHVGNEIVDIYYGSEELALHAPAELLAALGQLHLPTRALAKSSALNGCKSSAVSPTPIA